MTPRATTELDGVYRKIFQRLVPFLMLLWVLACRQVSKKSLDLFVLRLGYAETRATNSP